MTQSADLLRDGTVHILVNPAAGGRRSARWMPPIESFLISAGVRVQFHFTQSPAEMQNRALQAIRDGAHVLVAMGGDGTLQALVNAPGASAAVLGVLPTGGGNDFAAALGLPGNPLDALRAMVAGRVRSVDLARARTADGRERLYCGGGGLGLDAEAARHASETYGGWRGRPRYVLAALHALRSFSAVTVRARFSGEDNETVEKRVLVAAALNTPTYGAGLRLAEEATIDDGLLDVVFVEDLSALEIAGVVFHWAVRGKLHTRRISRWASPRVRLETDMPCQFHGDGEILGPTPVEVEVVPGAIRVLAP
jgi:diacylglycerol kinase (ATP)